MRTSFALGSDNSSPEILSPCEAMTILAKTFPSLTPGVPGIEPREQQILHEWVKTGVACHGARCSADFLLFVWNPYDDTPWAGSFRLDEALKTWDQEHRRAFLAWAAKPFWP